MNKTIYQVTKHAIITLVLQQLSSRTRGCYSVMHASAVYQQFGLWQFTCTLTTYDVIFAFFKFSAFFPCTGITVEVQHLLNNQYPDELQK